AERQAAERARAEIEGRGAALDAAIADLRERDVDVQSSYLVKALRQDTATFAGESALDHYRDAGTALIKRERGLGRTVNARETEAQRKTRMAGALGRASAQTKEVNTKQRKQEADQAYGQE
ncbi:MAG: hypothetical protein WAU30_13320, partial [Propionicimonas sp.]